MESTNKKINIEISTGTIFKLLIVLLGIFFLYLIRDVIVILFFVLILVSILEPAVGFLVKKKIPKILAVISVYLVMLAILALVVVLIIPPITDQAQQLVINFPNYVEKITDQITDWGGYFNQYAITRNIVSSISDWKFQLPDMTSGIFTRVGDFITDVFSVFVILVITFYFLVEENATKRILRSLLPSYFLPYTYQLLSRIQQKLGLWLRAQLILGLIIFFIVYIVLLSLNVKYALILAIIAGILEFVPYLGPLFSGFMAVTLTFLHSPLQGLIVLAVYILIQIFENNILVPQIMQKTVGLNPVISILAILIGGKLGGIGGVILAIPTATALSVIIEDFLNKKKDQELQLE